METEQGKPVEVKKSTDAPEVNREDGESGIPMRAIKGLHIPD